MALRFDGNIYSIDELATLTKVTNAGNEDAHLHRFIELVYVLKGRTVQIVDGVEYPAAGGDLVLINESQRHSMICQEGTQYINILMKPQIINQSITDTGNAFSLLVLKDFAEFKNTVQQSNRRIRFSGSERKWFEMLLQWLLQEQNQGNSGSELMLKSGINMLLIQVFRKMALPMRRSDSGIDASLLSHLQENCHRRIYLEEIAKSCGYESSYFSRLFKKSTGKTFTAYIADCRMKKACNLLETSDISVDSVIAECGFSDRTKFFRQFSKRIGMTPFQYRKSKN